MKDQQLTLRLPRELARALAERARESGTPKSQLVREALQAYLAGGAEVDQHAAWQRVARLVGSVALDPAAVERDVIASQIRSHNWRK
jgi:hypothetical protein